MSENVGQRCGGAKISNEKSMKGNMIHLRLSIILLAAWLFAVARGDELKGGSGVPLEPSSDPENPTRFMNGSIVQGEDGVKYYLSDAAKEAGAAGIPLSQLRVFNRRVDELINGVHVADYWAALQVMNRAGFAKASIRPSELYGSVESQVNFLLKAGMDEGWVKKNQSGGHYGVVPGQSLADPVNAVTGAFYMDETDLSLAGAMPLAIRRQYNSKSLEFSEVGYGWSLSMVPYLAERTLSNGTNILVGFELDATSVEYVCTEGNNGPWTADATYTSEDDNLATVANQHLGNASIDGVGSVFSARSQKIVRTTDENPPPGFSGTKHTLTGADGSERSYYTRSFPLNGTTVVERSRPYLYQWKDHRGNVLTFSYFTEPTDAGYGMLRRIDSSSGQWLVYDYDGYARVKSISCGDGRRVNYRYSYWGDLETVELPDGAVIRYEYAYSTEGKNNEVVAPYSTHRVARVIKPDGRILKNVYDKRSRVSLQWTNTGPGGAMARTSTFVYGSASGVDDGDDEDPRADDNMTGWTRVYNFENNPSITPETDQPGLHDDGTPVTLGSNCTLIEYSDGLITRMVENSGAERTMEWYDERNSYPNPDDDPDGDGGIAVITGTPGQGEPGGFPRSLKLTTDSRGLKSYYWYDGLGRVVRTLSNGDHTGSGARDSKIISYGYDGLGRQEWVESEVIEDGPAVTHRVEYSYMDSAYPRLVTRITNKVDDKVFLEVEYRYGAVTKSPSEFAKGLLVSQTIASGTNEAVHLSNEYDWRGFVTKTTSFSGKGASAVPQTMVAADNSASFVYNNMGQLVESVGRGGTRARMEYDLMGRETLKQVYDASGNLMASTATYFNHNGEVTWVDGPQTGAEDYVFRDYDAGGRLIAEIVWRSEASDDGASVRQVAGHDHFLTQGVTRFSYDPSGNLKSVTDPRGHETIMDYDQAGRMVASRSFEGSAATGVLLKDEYRNYYKTGDLRVVRDSSGLVSTYQYNAHGKVIKSTSADGTISHFRYYVDGRPHSQSVTDKGGVELSSAETKYDDCYVDATAGNAVRKKVTTSFPTGPAGTTETLFDCHGNPVSNKDLAGNVTKRSFDGLGRNVQTIGPPPSSALAGRVAVQSAMLVYDQVNSKIHVTDGTGGVTVTQNDALGRPVLQQVFANGSQIPARTVRTEYSPDHHAVTIAHGDPAIPDNFPRKERRLLDHSQRVVAVHRFTDAQNFTTSIQRYDAPGNVIESVDEMGNVTAVEYDGQNRLATTRFPDGGTASFTYDLHGNLTSRRMPGGLRWSAAYDQASRMIWEKLTGSDGRISRHFTREYYGSGEYAGLLHRSHDVLRGLETVVDSYDNQRRPEQIRSISSDPDIQPVIRSCTYDVFGKLTLVKTRNAASDASAIEDSVSVARAYDGYGQLDDEDVYIEEALADRSQQDWDASGRRVALRKYFNGLVGATYSFGWEADGLLASVTGPVAGKEVTASYTSSGSLKSIAGPWATTVTTAKDWSGRPLARFHGMRSSSGAVAAPTGAQGLKPTGNSGQNWFSETLAYRTDGLLRQRTYDGNIVGFGAAPAETKTYDYDPKGRLISEEGSRAEPLLPPRESLETFDFDVNHLGVLVGRNRQESAGSTTFAPQTWKVQGDGLDGTSRPHHVLMQYAQPVPIHGELSAHAAVKLEVQSVQSGTTFKVNAVKVAAKQPFNGGYTWATELPLPQGDYELVVTATLAGGQEVKKLRSFTVAADSSISVDSEYDEAGFLRKRMSSDGKVQHFRWDALGRLLGINEIWADNSKGYTWSAIYDGYGRRIRWSYITRPGGDGRLAGDVSFTVDSRFDPQVEFMEVGRSWAGTHPHNADYSSPPTWFVYGPSQSGIYGDQNGIGSLHGFVKQGTTTGEGILTDVTGDVIGHLMNLPGMEGAISTGLTRDPYGDSSRIFVPREAKSVFTEGENSMGVTWKSRSVDPTGFICLGERYYEPSSGRFLSPDPLGHAASMDLYMYAGGDPVNHIDSDGRQRELYRTIKAEEEMASYYAWTVGWTPIGVFNSMVELATGDHPISGREGGGSRGWALFDVALSFGGGKLAAKPLKKVFGPLIGSGDEVGDAALAVGRKSLSEFSAPKIWNYDKLSASMAAAMPSAPAKPRPAGNVISQTSSAPAPVPGSVYPTPNPAYSTVNETVHRTTKTVDNLASSLGREAAESAPNYVYRAVTGTDLETIQAGLGILRGSGNTTPTQHVLGVKHAADPWVSATYLEESAHFFATHGGTKPAGTIVRIDLNKLKNPVIDVSNQEAASAVLKHPRAINFSASHREILIEGGVNPEAISIFSP